MAASISHDQALVTRVFARYLSTKYANMGDHLGTGRWLWCTLARVCWVRVVLHMSVLQRTAFSVDGSQVNEGNTDSIGKQRQITSSAVARLGLERVTCATFTNPKVLYS